MRLGVIGGCIERERENRVKSTGGVFIIFTVWQLQPGEFTHSSLFRAKIFFFDKSTFWMYEIPSWNINGPVSRWSRCISVCCIRHFLNSIVVRFRFTSGCTSQSAKWYQLHTILSLHLFPTTIWIELRGEWICMSDDDGSTWKSK